MSALVHLGFYRGRDDGDLLDRLIAAHDAGPYSHVELVFSPSPRIGRPLCCSSSFRDGGVRFKHLRLGGEQAHLWDVLPVPVSPRDVSELHSFCRDHVGGRYDYLGVLAFKIPLLRHKLNWWFCSEFVVAALQRAGRLSLFEPSRLTPNGLFRLLQEGPSCKT